MSSVFVFYYLFQFDESRKIRSRFESSLRASIRVTKYLEESWNVDKPFANLRVSSMATKLLGLTVGSVISLQYNN